MTPLMAEVLSGLTSQPPCPDCGEGLYFATYDDVDSAYWFCDHCDWEGELDEDPAPAEADHG